MSKRRKIGMTLIEVLIAVAIAGAGLAVLMTGVARCITVMKKALFYQKAQWAMGLGEVEYPLVYSNDISELEVAPMEFENGFTYSRYLDDAEDEGFLRVLTMKTIADGKDIKAGEEVQRYVFDRKAYKDAER